MKAGAVEMAREALDSAHASLQAFNASPSVEEKRTHWRDFLYSLAEVFEKIYSGARGHPNAEPWAGGIKKRRKDDPLLSYMHHARDVRYHGLSPVTRNADRFALVKNGEKAFTGPRKMILRIKADPQFAGYEMVPEPPDLRLVDVTDVRYGDTFRVPRSDEYDTRPVPYMYGGYAWHKVREIVEEAEARYGQAPQGA